MTDERLHKLMITFPKKSSIDPLVRIATQFGFDDAGESEFNAWMEKEKANEVKQELIDSRLQTLIACFPEEAKDVLIDKASKYELNDNGTIELEKWIDQNKQGECKCCFNTCLDMEMLACLKGHLFCKECIKRGSDVAIGDGKASLSCFFEGCNSLFDLKVLNNALDN